MKPFSELMNFFFVTGLLLFYGLGCLMYNLYGRASAALRCMLLHELELRHLSGMHEFAQPNDLL